MSRLLAAVLALMMIPGAACSSASAPDSAPAPAAQSSPHGETESSEPSDASAGKGAPELRVKRVATGLDHPWDVRPIGHGRLLVTERAGRLSVIEDGEVRRLQMPTDLIWASGETGLMGLALDPDFADNGRFFTCNGGNPQGTPTSASWCGRSTLPPRGRRTRECCSPGSRRPAAGTAVAAC